MIVAIDGPAGSGKSTTAKQTAEILNFVHIDTGAMYRAVTYYFLENNILNDDTHAIDNALEKISIYFENDIIYLNQVDVSKEIRSNIVSQTVSKVSALPKVRKNMLHLQRRMLGEKNVLIEGRDIGTRVFPNADVKIFLNASLKVRGNRRYSELRCKKVDISLKQVIEELKLRDTIDSNRVHSPLKKAEDAIEIDTSEMNINEQVAKIVEIINKIQNRSMAH